MEKSKLVSEFLSLVDVDNFDDVYSKDIFEDNFFGMPLGLIVDAEKRLRSSHERHIAYFSMEYGLGSGFYNRFKSNRQISSNNNAFENEIFSNQRFIDYYFTIKIGDLIGLPIYSGGLGVLAGDTVKTMADYKLPAVCLGMLWKSGYFRQKFWFKYGQVPEEMNWDQYTYPGLIPLKNKIKISLKNEDIYLKIWKYYVYSYKHDGVVPLILLDSDVEENNEKNRTLTNQLYKSDNAWIKAMQRIILGMGGALALKELGYNIDIYHLNEGHAVFAFLGKAREWGFKNIEELKKHFVYTCHTPVEAGHDKFTQSELKKIFDEEDLSLLEKYGKDSQHTINLTLLAMNVSSIINAVSLNHQKVMHIQFPKYKDRIKFVTNGVHPYTWITEPFMELYNKFPQVFEDVRSNPMVLKRAEELRPSREFRSKLWQTHQVNKANLCGLLDKWRFNKDVFTICWARRVAAYKRPSLILSDVNRLIDISKKIGPIQIIFAGKAHPADNLGFTYINEMLDKVDSLSDVYDNLKIAILENYNMSLARILASSVDVWLNNPLPPFEASGTSGMKALLNGVIQFSTFDGWVAEGASKKIGTIFGYRNEEGQIGDERNLHIEEDSIKLYDALEEMARLYYATNDLGKVDLNSKWIDTMINCIIAGSYFNTYRMLDEYKSDIWKLA